MSDEGASHLVAMIRVGRPARGSLMARFAASRRTSDLRFEPGSCSGCAPLVMPVEAASFGDLRHVPELGPLHQSRLRTVHAERPVTTPLVIVLKVVAEEPP